ncbi:MAG TPA: hypothetical protein VNJ52_13550 [Patescibacteria group bacterium]|nr:hypothetical protein [Patescibacteria group bacterium]
MASESSLEDRAPSGRFYMNKLFGRGVERARALDRDGESGKALGTVRRVTIEPQSNGSHRVVVEHSTTIEQGGRHGAGSGAGKGQIAESPVSEHSFAGAGDALRFLSDVLSNRPPAPAAGSGESGRPDAFADTGRSASSGSDRFLDQILDEHGASGE